MQAVAQMAHTLILLPWLVRVALLHVQIAYPQQVVQLAKLDIYTIVIIVYLTVPLVCTNLQYIVSHAWVCALLVQALPFAHLAQAII